MSEPVRPQEPPAPDDTSRAVTGLHESAQRAPQPVSGEAVQAFLAADVEWARQAHPAVWQSLDYDRARALLEAAAPLIAAAERERITGLFGGWIEILMSEPNAHPPSAWKAGFADLLKIGSEEEDRG